MSLKKQEKKIKIGIDARFYGPRQKGLGRYVQKLIKSLEKIEPAYQYVIFLRKENWPEYQPSHSCFKKVLADCRWYTLKEQILMPWKIWRAGVDLMHFPHFNIPLLYRGPFVVTIHDLILKSFSTRRASTRNFLWYWLKNLFYHWVIWTAVRRARRIIAVSHYTRKEILRYFRIDSKKIKVIYEGSPLESGIFQKEKTTEASSVQEKTNSLLKKTLRKFNITKPYLLYVGNAYPHKNLERLILAFNQLNDSRYQLVLVGEMDYFYRRLKKFAESLPLKTRQAIIFTGFVTDEDLKIIFQGASLYVFPSLCEGFGLPPLEALAFCRPVVSSWAASLPEILKQAAVYFDPEKVDEITAKIKYVLESPIIQKKLIQEGERVVRQYSWLKMARQTQEVYRTVLVEKKLLGVSCHFKEKQKEDKRT